MSNIDTNTTPEDKANVRLPQWLLDALPPHLPFTVISYADGQFHVSHDGAVFGDIVEAYDHISAEREAYQIHLDPSVHGKGGCLTEIGFIETSDNHDGSDTLRVLPTMSSQEIVEDLRDDYAVFITELTPAYKENPNDFLKAHRWLSYHPAFWVKGRKEKDFFWDTTNGLLGMKVRVTQSVSTGAPLVELLHGRHEEKEGYTTYSSDPRINAHGSTYEEAIIEMASLVYGTYRLDGTMATFTTKE